jgi:hypothetical protein
MMFFSLALYVLGTRSVGAQGVERLAWLAGCWEHRAASRTVEEY